MKSSTLSAELLRAAEQASDDELLKLAHDIVPIVTRISDRVTEIEAKRKPPLVIPPGFDKLDVDPSTKLQLGDVVVNPTNRRTFVIVNPYELARIIKDERFTNSGCYALRPNTDGWRTVCQVELSIEGIEHMAAAHTAHPMIYKAPPEDGKLEEPLISLHTMDPLHIADIHFDLFKGHDTTPTR